MGKSHLPGRLSPGKPAIPRCAICHSVDAVHSCTLEPDASSTGWLARFTPDPVHGRLLRDRQIVWSCAHRHRSPREAIGCAQQVLALLQRPDSLVTDLPRPKMSQQAEVWPARTEVPGLTDAAWSEIKAIFRDRCRYCGSPDPSDREHRVPLSRGGGNRIANIVPACQGCNQAKGSATEDEFLTALRALWGRRAPRTPARLDIRLRALEGRYAPGHDYSPDRGVVLLSKVLVPRSRWFPEPQQAEFVIHRNRQVRVAGISYHQNTAAKVVGSSQRWSGPVALVPDPSNPVDPNAVGIWHRKGQLGWLPKEVAARVAGDLLANYRSRVATVARADVFEGKEFIGARVKLDEPIAMRPA